MKIKTVFELELEDKYYQEILERIERDGKCNLSSYFIVLRKPDGFDCIGCNAHKAEGTK